MKSYNFNIFSCYKTWSQCFLLNFLQLSAGEPYPVVPWAIGAGSIYCPSQLNREMWANFNVFLPRNAPTVHCIRSSWACTSLPSTESSAFDTLHNQIDFDSICVAFPCQFVVNAILLVCQRTNQKENTTAPHAGLQLFIENLSRFIIANRFMDP